MVNRRKQIEQESASLFARSINKTDTPALEGLPVVIGGNTGPKTRYYRYDEEGNIILLKSSDMTDPWWGLRYEGQQNTGVLVGRTPIMFNVFSLVEKLSNSIVWVLIEGESGTGKELLAASIASVKRGPFVPVNCGFPEGGVSFEDSLFGRIDKVINGATRMEGAFHLANGGVIFLDNIDCITLRQQSKLLRVLQSQPQTVYKVGSSEGKTVDVRVICATNKDLLSLIRRGEFREDLYYRINCVQVNLPPLRDRVEDIPHLVVYFLFKHSLSSQRKVNVILSESLKKLFLHDWPGNVRELEQIIKRALATGDGPVLRPEEITFNLSADITYKSFQRQPSSINPKNLYQSLARDNLEIIQELLRQNPGSTSKELARLKGRSIRDVERDLAVLKGELVISRKDERDARINRYYLIG